MTAPLAEPTAADRESWALWLLPDERLLWVGRPGDQLIVSLWKEAPVIAFTSVWLAGAVFWNLQAWVSGAPLFFRLFGAPFVLVGLYAAFGRFFWDRAERRSARYALTDRRAIETRTFPRRDLRSVPLGSVAELGLEPSAPGRPGTVRFGPPALSFRGFPMGGRRGTGQASLTFELIAEAEAVYAAVADRISNASRGV